MGAKYEVVELDQVGKYYNNTLNVSSKKHPSSKEKNTSTFPRPLAPARD